MSRVGGVASKVHVNTPLCVLIGAQTGTVSYLLSSPVWHTQHNSFYLSTSKLQTNGNFAQAGVWGKVSRWMTKVIFNIRKRCWKWRRRFLNGENIKFHVDLKIIFLFLTFIKFRFQDLTFFLKLSQIKMSQILFLVQFRLSQVIF